MEIKELKKRPSIDQNKKLISAYAQFDQLLTELKKKELPEEIVKSINNGIDQINSVSESENELRKQIRKTQSVIPKLSDSSFHLPQSQRLFQNFPFLCGIKPIGV